MELVYLWVEGYKNIYKQGFNFSPRFECKYENNELNICDKKSELAPKCKDNNYIENFFGTNINVTAIIGKNGSGKSSLVLSILNMIYSDRDITNIIFVYFDNAIKVYQYGIPHLSTPNLEIKELKNIINKKAYSLLMDFSISHIDFLNSAKEKEYKKNYSLEPSRLYQSRGGDRTKIEPSAYNMNMKVNLLYFYFYIKENKLDNILKNFNLPNFDRLVYKRTSKTGKPLKEKRFNDITKHKIFDIDFSKCKTFKDVEEKIPQKFSKNIKDIAENDLDKIEDLLIYVDLEMKSIDNLSFDDLSSGQKILLSYIGIILRTYIKLQKTDKDTFNIYIDEFETSLHPLWQKKFLDFLVKMIESLGINKNYIVNIIITSHSPFLLSDIPKQNTIFLDTLKDGNCINVSSEIDIKPFGANIHELLSHGFFMEDGLMGEFAKSKINKIIRFLNGDNKFIDFPIEQIIKVIESIGEDLLRMKLLDMYYEKFEKDELEREKQQLLEQQEEIKRRIKSIEAKQK